jgi:hypothetical protein
MGSKFGETFLLYSLKKIIYFLFFLKKREIMNKNLKKSKEAVTG